MSKFREWGCLFFASTLALTCVLFIANQSVVAACFHLLVLSYPDLFNSQGARQFAMFVGPVVLVFLEWWLIDTLFWRTLPEDPDEDDVE